MSTGPEVVRTAVTQVMVVSSITLRDLTFKPPNLIILTPIKDVPVIVTIVPPIVPPYDGEILVIFGGVR